MSTGAALISGSCRNAPFLLQMLRRLLWRNSSYAAGGQCAQLALEQAYPAGLLAETGTKVRVRELNQAPGPLPAVQPLQINSTVFSGYPANIGTGRRYAVALGMLGDDAAEGPSLE